MPATKTGPNEWQVSTDEKHTVTVDSYLISAEWLNSAAYGGQEAPFIITTALLGYGTTATVTGMSENGVDLGQVEVPIRMDRGQGALSIPDDVTPGDRIFFTVDFGFNVVTPAGVANRATPIPVLPRPYVTEMCWGQPSAFPEELVDLNASLVHVHNGARVLITIYRVLEDDAHDKITAFHATVTDNSLTAKWLAGVDIKDEALLTKPEAKKRELPHENPRYIFTVTIGAVEHGRAEERSGRLEVLRNPLYRYSA